MPILAIDTTSEFGSLALVSEGAVIEEVLLHSPDGFGHILFDQVDRLLKRHNLTARDIIGFVSSSGPGSFTGVRVGLAAIKGLAATLSRPVAAVSNLQALASFGNFTLRATLLDARRGEVYGAVYDSSLKLLEPEVVTSFPAWLHTLPMDGLEFIAQDFTPFRPALAGTRWEAVPVTQAPRALAGAIGRIGWNLIREGRGSDPAAIDANYVRRSDAERFWTDS